ncbi:MAG: hypothetical protein COW88_00390 [Candidatus Lloydbacteria bacterium CG22_combo_CG10-13_8_21_14_all_47_15]|uniref:PrkA AAA domain-containing protein n=1 Tax=Candidatus Lloydbacteria bacterium CG22_combo_CG10-13_8_21_14_all_47_15 TaxID=1974635 RepID=A0A2H0CVH2_9BACT|nr:MAG: hypothetical protein COW88_00390 [Candidatus Lloydbacteria bacterium CG22_combo_CG10-13_8_21_14_all_47_15]
MNERKENSKLDVNGIIDKDIQQKKDKKRTKIEIPFKEYLKLVEQDPKIAQNAHARALEIILSAGVETIPEHEQCYGIDRRYSLFTNELYGIDKTISDFVDYLEAGAHRASSGKHVVLFLGPPGTGKSTIVRILMNAFEHYQVRPVFMIKGCPKFEEPLHLLPRNMREEIAKKLGIRIEGDLCPVCRDRLIKNYADGEEGTIRWWDVPVETLTFSKQGVRGLTSFEPSDEKSSDITTLTGRINIGVTSDPDRGYTDPYAYEITGKIPKGERGIFEPREICKNPSDILGIFFSVAEEREFEIQGSSFPHLSTDTIIISHTNLSKFKKFEGDKDNEGLHQRFHIISCPYPLRVKDELKTYQKLIERDSDFVSLKKCHIAPGSLELAATFAILTRLVESQKGIDLLTKAKLYNGEMLLADVEEDTDEVHSIRELMDEGQVHSDTTKKEGMFGVTPRDVLTALNSAIVEQSRKTRCLTPLNTIHALRNVFEHRMGYSPEELARFKTLLDAEEGESVVTEFRQYVMTMVNQAFLEAYDDLARQLFNDYIREIELYRSTKRQFVKTRLQDVPTDPLTGKPKEANMKLMRSIEQHIPLTEEQAERARGEYLERAGKDPSFSYEKYRPLARAVERKLLSDSRETLSIVLSTDKPHGSEETKRVDNIFKALKDKGFCPVCSKEIVNKAREFLNE